jgi:hypothetical protein
MKKEEIVIKFIGRIDSFKIESVMIEVPKNGDYYDPDQIKYDIDPQIFFKLGYINHKGRRREEIINFHHREALIVATTLKNITGIHEPYHIQKSELKKKKEKSLKSFKDRITKRCICEYEREEKRIKEEIIIVRRNAYKNKLRIRIQENFDDSIKYFDEEEITKMWRDTVLEAVIKQ